jgi:hypothetical protein
MHDVGRRRTPDNVTFVGVRRDDVANHFRKSAIHRQRNARTRMPQQFASLARFALPSNVSYWL